MLRLLYRLTLSLDESDHKVIKHFSWVNMVINCLTYVEQLTFTRVTVLKSLASNEFALLDMLVARNLPWKDITDAHNYSSPCTVDE